MINLTVDLNQVANKPRCTHIRITVRNSNVSKCVVVCCDAEETIHYLLVSYRFTNKNEKYNKCFNFLSWQFTVSAWYLSHNNNPKFDARQATMVKYWRSVRF